MCADAIEELAVQVRSIRSVSNSEAEAVIVGMYPGRRIGPGGQPVMKALGPWARQALSKAEFDGDVGQVATLPSAGAQLPSTVVFVGLGEDVDMEALRQAAGRGMRAAGKARTIATTLHRLPIDGAVDAVLEGVGLGDYRFDRYRSTVDERSPLTVELIGGSKDTIEAASRASVVVESVALAADLVNEPSVGKAPLDFAEQIVQLADEFDVDSEVWSGEDLVTEEMAGLMAVGGGSHRSPCMLRLDYRPRRAKATLCLVGKGIVFDSGGLSLKTATYMEDMKSDMAGAAAVCAAVLAVARLGLRVNVTGFAALAENMPGGGAQRPGDVITYRNGKTVEVLNTDAEGRLVLADGLCLAVEEDPDLIVDLATLTGACKVALGPSIAGLFGHDADAVAAVQAAADSAGERVWTMPLPEDYQFLIESRIADMKNTITGRYGGAQGAALLLAAFVEDRPWAHLDIAGPAFTDREDHYIPKGGTGFGVRTLIELASSMV